MSNEPERTDAVDPSDATLDAVCRQIVLTAEGRPVDTTTFAKISSLVDAGRCVLGTTDGLRGVPSIPQLQANTGFGVANAEFGLLPPREDPAGPAGGLASVLHEMSTVARDVLLAKAGRGAGEELESLSRAARSLAEADPESEDAKAMVRDVTKRVRARLAEIASTPTPLALPLGELEVDE